MACDDQVIVGPANGVKPRQVLTRPVGEASSVPSV